MKLRRKRRNHQCPPWCHHCPDMCSPEKPDGGEIMPLCWALVMNPATTLAACVCDRPKRWLARFKDAEDAAFRAMAAEASLRDELRATRDELRRLEAYARSRWGPLPWDPEDVKRRAGVKPSEVRTFVPRGDSA